MTPLDFLGLPGIAWKGAGLIVVIYFWAGFVFWLVNGYVAEEDENGGVDA